jgi:predicted metal-dependent phosphoesterase TrpH
MQIKGVLHMHSTHSYDGKVSLPELKVFLKERGISFCCMTEHTDELTQDTAQAFVSACEELSDASFVFIPGFEVPYKDAHILHIGAREFVCQFADTHQLQQWKSKASLVILAHPVRNSFILDATTEELVDGVEVWNQQYEGKKAPRIRSMKLLQQLQIKNSNLLATGGLDFHRREHYGSPITTLEVDECTEQNIIESLKAGKYTFGNTNVALSSKGELLKGNYSQVSADSALSISVIVVGKFVNKILAKLGLSLPQTLKKAIRSNV